MTALPPAGGPPMWRAVLALALPALAQQYLLFLIQRYDQFLARAFTPSHQAALTTANYLYWFVSSYTVVVAAGATAVVGRMVGAKGWGTANRAAGQAVFLAALFGSAASVVGLAGGIDWLVTAIALPGGSNPIAAEYLKPLAAVLALQMIESGGIACLIGAGDTRTGLYVLAGVAAVNVPAAYLLSESVGFVGIAWGTALSHAAGGLAVFAMLVRGRSGLKVDLGFLIPNPALLRRLLRVSVPAAVDSMSTAVCQLWFLSLVNRLGEHAAAAHGIAIGWEALGYLAGAAFGIAATSLVSRSLGARRPDLAARGGRTAFALGCGAMVFMGAVFFLLARPMCGLFSREAEVIDLGVMALRTIAFAMPALACTIVFTASLRGAGDTRVPVLFTWAGFLGVRMPLAYWLTGPGMGWGLQGIWVAMLADIWVRGTLFAVRFAGGKWKRVKV